MSVDLKIEGAGIVIRQARTTAGFGEQQLFAQHAEIPASTLSRYERNERPLNLMAIRRIAQACDVPAKDLALKCLSEAYPGMLDDSLGRSLGSLVDLMLQDN